MNSEFIKQIRYIRDEDVDQVLNEKLIRIISSCFQHVERFKTQRFCYDMPKHRWYIEKDGMIIAHIAIHEKEFEIEGKKEGFIGVAEVCVIPEYRGLKLLKLLLRQAEEFFPNYKYSILLGKEKYYGSSGYSKVGNVYFSTDLETPADGALVKCLKDFEWPEGKVVIEGFPF